MCDVYVLSGHLLQHVSAATCIGRGQNTTRSTHNTEYAHELSACNIQVTLDRYPQQPSFHCRRIAAPYGAVCWHQSAHASSWEQRFCSAITQLPD